MSDGDSFWVRVDAHFEAALDRSGPERARYLAELHRDDAALHDAVVKLLSVERRIGAFLEDSGPHLPTELMHDLASSDRASDPFEPGHVLDRYRLLGVLGRGGTSTVYLAERADQMLNQLVAIKVLHRGASSADLAERLHREQQVLSELDHPNLAAIFDAGVSDGGHPYLVVERVEGEIITRYADEARLSIAQRLELFAEIAHAVHYLHRNLVVHRDLKPSNILVTNDGRPKLLDFGVAKILEPGISSLEATVTTRWMTPRYAAPEQILADTITTATDIHALGALLYELLAGVPAFGRETSSRFEIEQAICRTEPSAPSAVAGGGSGASRRPAVAEARRTDPGTLRQTLDGDLDAIILKALRKEPSDRYASAEAMADDVERYLTGFPVEARSGAATYRARKFIRRHRWGVAAAATIALLLVGGSAALAIQQTEVARARDEATRAAAAAEEQARNAEATVDFLADIFRGRDPTQAPGDTVTALELVEWAEERVEVEFDDQPALRADLLGVLADAYDNLGYLDRGRALAVRSVELDRTRGGDEGADRVATGLIRLSGNLRAARQFDSAAVVARQATELLRSSPQPDSARLAAALSELGLALRDRGQLDAAEARLRHAMEIRAGRQDEDEASYVRSVLNLAYVLRRAGEVEEAEALYRQGITRLRDLPGEVEPTFPAHLNNLAYLLKLKGDLRGAESLYREALQRLDSVYGRAHPHTIVVARNLATVLAEADQAEVTDSILSASVQALREDRRVEPTRLAVALEALGQFRLMHDRAGSAREPLLEAVDLYREILGSDSPWTIFATAKVGIQEMVTGREPDGRQKLDETLARLESWAGSTGQLRPDGVAAVQNLVRVLEAVGLEAEVDPFRWMVEETGDP